MAMNFIRSSAMSSLRRAPGVCPSSMNASDSPNTLGMFSSSIKPDCAIRTVRGLLLAIKLSDWRQGGRNGQWRDVRSAGQEWHHEGHDARATTLIHLRGSLCPLCGLSFPFDHQDSEGKP